MRKQCISGIGWCWAASAGRGLGEGKTRPCAVDPRGLPREGGASSLQSPCHAHGGTDTLVLHSLGQSLCGEWEDLGAVVHSIRQAFSKQLMR